MRIRSCTVTRYLSFSTLLFGLVACNKPAEPATKAEPEKPAAEAAPSAAPAPAAETAATTPAAAPTNDPKALPAPADVATPPADAKKTASGLATKVLTPGKGKDHPKDEDSVKVHYTGWTSDGKMFDSSVVRGEPTSFGVTQVIAGWTEALKLMVVGEKRRMWIPAKIAYGETARPGYPAGQLTFDVELLEITSPPKPPETPKDVAAAPADAKKTASGLAYRTITKGTGKDHPGPTSRVKVHYSGWTKDGKMFDSSVTRGEPTSFGLNQVIPGWTEGVQLMVKGEKTRFWIPGKLAYGDEPKRPGAPSGQLTFDIELLDFTP
ncbi:MAG TPA: FKBP-type peptidyl-prolyl cis-trans isomerase [Polyangiaceae bacterium]|nr:FKBP-type peptidyl-prolyl cis-trans isomerase [Polyangiaceae bacterium]